MERPITPYKNLNELHQAVAEEFCALVKSSIEANGRFTVSLSGGSTPKRIYELLSQRDLPWEQTHWFWGDERNVPHEHDESNFRMVSNALLNHVPVPKANIHPVPVDTDDPQATAEQYDRTIRSHFPNSDFPQWDLALLGMGDDAHTASLFPETTALSEKSKWFVQNWVEKFNAFRYTLTEPAINSAKNSWFLIAGANKRDALAQVLSDDQNPKLYPSQLIHPTKWFINADAMTA